MSGFTSEVLEKKLNDLNNSQQSIQTLSLWLIHHRKHCKLIVQTWLKELKKVKQSKRLTFMYLANDVIQNSRKKGVEFTKEFIYALKFAFEFVSKDADEKMYNSLDRILSIWSERSIYDQNLLIEFRKNLKHSIKTPIKTPPPTEHHHSAKKRKETPTSDDSPSKIKKVKVNLLSKSDVELPIDGKDVDSKELINCLKNLENTASSDAVVRERIAKLPPEVSDTSYLEKLKDKDEVESLGKKVDEACDILNNYNQRLAQELEKRKEISFKLAAYSRYQRQLQDKAQKQLNEFIERLNKIKHVKNELKLHLKNLLDLDKLPSIEETPLPKPGELFSGKKDESNKNGLNINKVVNKDENKIEDECKNETNENLDETQDNENVDDLNKRDEENLMKKESNYELNKNNCISSI